MNNSSVAMPAPKTSSQLPAVLKPEASQRLRNSGISVSLCFWRYSMKSFDTASRRPGEEILRKLPSMYHQFKELADVDITKEPMEVGPAQHYVMGGVEVDPDTGASSVPGLYAAGEVSGGMHGSNRLGGNSLSDLLVFGRQAGMGAAQYLDWPRGARPRGGCPPGGGTP